MSFSPTMGVTAYDGGSPFDFVFDNIGPNNQPLYEGASYPGTVDTVGVLQWRIRKFFFDGNGQVSGWRWANASTAFQFDWTLRATYTYTSL
jgi:hypothetical protein